MGASGDCPRKSSLPGIPETACSARDPCPQRSASSDPPANRAGIISRESNPAARFYTARVIRVGDDQGESKAHVGIAPKADANSSLSRRVPEPVSKIPLGTGRRTLLASFCRFAYQLQPYLFIRAGSQYSRIAGSPLVNAVRMFRLRAFCPIFLMARQARTNSRFGLALQSINRPKHSESKYRSS